MATKQDIRLSDLLGKNITLSEDFYGVQVEHSGQVIGIISALPGSRCSEEFLLDQDDGDCRYYSPSEVTFLHIE